MIKPSDEDHDAQLRFLSSERDTQAPSELVVDDREMRVRIFGDKRQLKKGPQFDTALTLDNGQVATLIECVRLSLGRVGPDPNAWLIEALPNLVVLGPQPWADGNVRQFIFTFTEAANALHYGAHMEAPEPENPPANTVLTFVPRHIDIDKLTILSLRCNGYDISIELQMNGSLNAFEPGLIFTPFVRVESETPRKFAEIHRFASQILTFFEISVGARSRMRSIHISSQTSAAQTSAFESDGTGPEFFQARMHYGTWTRGRRAHPGDAIFSVFSEEQRARTLRALQTWLGRVERWETTYALASFYLGRTGAFDRDRLLRVCAWFEALPIDAKTPNLSDEHVATITSAAQEAARQIGGDGLIDRIEGLLSNLKQKALRRQVLDVCASLRARFGQRAVPLQLDRDLPIAAKLRSRASHGSQAFDDADSAQLINATRALEAVCLMATIDGLTQSGGFDSPYFGHHPLMEYVLEHQ